MTEERIDTIRTTTFCAKQGALTLDDLRTLVEETSGLGKDSIIDGVRNDAGLAEIRVTERSEH